MVIMGEDRRLDMLIRNNSNSHRFIVIHLLPYNNNNSSSSSNHITIIRNSRGIRMGMDLLSR